MAKNIIFINQLTIMKEYNSIPRFWHDGTLKLK